MHFALIKPRGADVWRQHHRSVFNAFFKNIETAASNYASKQNLNFQYIIVVDLARFKKTSLVGSVDDLHGVWLALLILSVAICNIIYVNRPTNDTSLVKVKTDNVY
jgi:hypothetical protein